MTLKESKKNNFLSRKILLYIVYGDQQIYYDGAIFSFLSFKYWSKNDNQIEIFILTENPEKFNGYPVNIIPLTKQLKSEWSLNGKYHFRIKNRGLAHAIDKIGLKDSDKLLFCDTDTYFNKSPLHVFDLIRNNQALLYLNEGLISKKKRFSVYAENLVDANFVIDGLPYSLSKDSAMWGSLLIGVTIKMRKSIDLADQIMLKLLDIVPAHTIEQFSLAEALKKEFKIVEGKNFIKTYTTKRMKENAQAILAAFFYENQFSSFDYKVQRSHKIKFRRPLLTIIKQRLKKFD